MGPGTVLRARRLALGLSQTGLSNAMGGSISPTWISRYENDLSEPAYPTAKRIANALRLDEEDVLNAFGLASERQREAAIARMAKQVKAPEEEMRVPVVGPDGEPTGKTAPAYVPPGETVVAVDLDDSEPPYTGVVTVSLSRRPTDGDFIVANTRQGMKAGRWRMPGRRRTWLETRSGDISGVTPFGVIISHG